MVGILLQLRLPRKDIFDSSSLSADLARKSVRSGASNISAQVVLFAFQLGGTVVLARLLTPADYGLIGMVAVITGFAGMFNAFGLSEATVQARTISEPQTSALFWVNAGVSLGLTLCVLAAAPLVAIFYHQPKLVAVTAALALSLVISGVAVQHDALLNRHMRFTSLALVSVVSQVVTTGVAIGLALGGVGYWALVGGPLAGSLASTLFTFYLCPWIPGRPRRRTGAGAMLKFGAHVTGFEFVNYFSRNLDNMLIGRYIGAAPLGLYAKAYQLFMLPITQIRAPVTQVGMPVLSSLRSQPLRYVRYYQRLTDILATLIMPLTTFAFVEADFLIRVMLGSQWMGAVVLFRILAVAGLVQGIASTRGLVLLTHGYSARYLRWGAANAVGMIVAFVIGLQFGVVGVAAAYAIANYVILIPSLYYCFHGTPVTVGLFLKTLVLPFTFSASAAAAALLARHTLGGESVPANLVASAVFALAYAGLSSLRPLVRDTVSRIIAGLSVIPPSQVAEGEEGQ